MLLIRALNFIINIYMVIIFVRIILTWFSREEDGVQAFLARITDPYLAWFRRFPMLRAGAVDLSPIAALGLLSLTGRILGTIERYGRISIGIILALALQAIWSAVSFILGFLMIILILRLIAQLFGFNIYSPFWNIIDSISRPVMFRFSKFLFKDRIVNFLTGLIVSIALLLIGYLALNVLVFIISRMLANLPI
jgi:YggT family protein